MRYRDCIFDLYGTLVDIHTDEGSPRLWAAMAAAFRDQGAAYAPEELHRAYLDAVAALERDARPLRQDAHEAHPEIQIEPVFRGLYGARGVAAGPALVRRTGLLFRRLSTDHIRLYPGVPAMLEALRRRGQRTYLLSNAQALFTRYELDLLGITGLFDDICLSSDHGCKKPDRRFYEVLLHRRGIDPAGAVMVGNDGLCDILGARALALATVYLHTDLSPQEPPPPADHRLEGPDMAALTALLGR